MIYTTYNVQIVIPDELFEFLDLIGPSVSDMTRDYQREIIEAQKGNDEAGTDYYSQPVEYATFCERAEAEACERKVTAVIVKYCRLMKLCKQPIGTFNARLNRDKKGTL